jgi:hypothetical protein
MDYFAGLDVSVKEISICIVDDAGRIFTFYQHFENDQLSAENFRTSSPEPYDPTAAFRLFACPSAVPAAALLKEPIIRRRR